jgi:thiamine biosynthesis protein ThiI
MEKLIMVKYGELGTKKDNINLFLKELKKNIDFILSDLKPNITYDKGRMFISSDEENFSKIEDKLKYVFGLRGYCIVYKLDTRDVNEIGRTALELIKDKDIKTFKVVTKRSDKNFPIESLEISKRVGGIILPHFDNLKVDVRNPELTINIEIRIDSSYIYFDTIKGIGGYPVGTLGKGLLMLSGGIDSPVAGYMAMKRGIKLEAIYFEAPPHTSPEARNKVIALAKKLAIYNNDIKLHIINFTEIETSIYKDCPRDYLITIMRRMMYRISAIIANRQNCKALINGESVGQVASQTLISMGVINQVTKLPVIRPLCCFDKLEIIDLAEKIDTYETSILPFEDCCTIFVPEHPVINPVAKLAEEYENRIDYKEMIYRAVHSREVIDISAEETNKFADLL